MKTKLLLATVLLLILFSCKTHEEKLKLIDQDHIADINKLRDKVNNINKLIDTHGIEKKYTVENVDNVSGDLLWQVLGDYDKLEDIDSAGYVTKAFHTKVDKTIFLYCNDLEEVYNKNIGKKYPFINTSIKERSVEYNDLKKINFSSQILLSSIRNIENISEETYKYDLEEMLKFNDLKYIAFVYLDYIVTPTSSEKESFSLGYVSATVKVFDINKNSLHKEYKAFATSSKEVEETSYSDTKIEITEDDLLQNLISNLENNVVYKLIKK